MEKTRFWSRVGDWFRYPNRTAEADHRPADFPDSAEGGSVEVESHSAARRPLVRRDPAERERLDQALSKIAELVESIQHHFKAQDIRTERIAESLQSIAESLADIPDSTKKQTETLARIREQLEIEIAANKRLEDALSELPNIADSQRETMVSIGRQLDAVREAEASQADSLGEVRGTVDRVEVNTADNISLLKQWHKDSEARGDRLAQAVQEQTKRLTVFAYAALVVAVVAATVGLLALWR